jgi:uncharacterized iron-regulated protein
MTDKHSRKELAAMIPPPWLEEADIILIGELHGTIEIPAIIKAALSQCKKPIALAIEIPREDPQLFLKNATDGRAAWKSLVAHATSLRIPIHFIDSQQFITQDERERGLANAVLSIRASKLLVVTGDVHAAAKKIEFGEITLTPMGYYIKQAKPSTKAIQITARQGTFFSEGVQSFSESLAQHELFDHVLLLDTVQAYEG